MSAPVPVVALIAYPRFSPFHFAMPYMVFGTHAPGQPLFELRIVAPDEQALRAERALALEPDGGLELADTADILVVPGWHALDDAPSAALQDALRRAHARGARVVGLCYGTYALAYAGLLDGRRAATHWMAEDDFSRRFPRVALDANALYVEDDRLVTSAGVGAGLDCCLYIVRQVHGARVANRLARGLVIAPHREGGQAQFIEQPVAASTHDAKINALLDHLRANLATPHTVDDLAARTAMSRRTFTRHFRKATGMTLVEWLVNERLRRACELLETTSLPVEKISDLAGFQTPVSLREHFRKRHRVSPREWRRTFGTRDGMRAGA